MQKVVLIDDHILLRNGLANLIESFGNYKVLFQADNGEHFIEKLDASNLPDIILMDINMPIKDGFETSLWLKEKHPEIKILALSMYDNENSIIKMFKAGAKGYILKDCDPSELKTALNALATKGFFYSEMVTGKLIHSINALDEQEHFANNKVQLNDRETTFLKLVCSELTYKEIAEKMYVSPRTIDGYRDDLFEKLKVKTRVGLVMYAIKIGVVVL
ncbi:MAG TPA: response regulator transcription factor [Hanamia sp.]|nr:response regulator transcription factor [Hanamia sp.]